MSFFILITSEVHCICCERRQSKPDEVRHLSASSRDGGDEYSSEASEFDTTKHVSTDCHRV